MATHRSSPQAAGDRAAPDGADAPRPPSLGVAALVLLGATLLAFGPFLYATVRDGASSWGIHDWAQFYAWYDLPRTALIEHGEPAAWNPYVCGGLPGLAHTHDPTFSPVFLVILALGAVTGARVLMVAWVYAAMLSMFALARRMGLRRVGCYLAAVVWGLNGNLMLHATVGHLMHMAMGVLPLVLVLFLRERKSGSGVFLTSLLIGGLVLAGSIYPAVYAGLLLVVFALWLTILEGSGRWLSRLIVVGVFSVLVAAAKLVIAVPFLLRIQHAVEDVSATGPGFLWGRLIGPEPPWQLHTFGNYTLGYWEFGAYIGVAVVVLVAVGLARLAWQVTRAWRSREAEASPRWGALLIACLLFLLLSFGNRSPVDLFGLLKRLPILESLHVPFRFVIVPLMGAALLAGWGLDWFAARGRWVRTAAIILLAAIGLDLAWVYQHLIPQSFAVNDIDVAAGRAVATDVRRLPPGAATTAAEGMVVADVGEEGPAFFEQRRVAGGGTGPLSRHDRYVIQPHAAVRYLMQLQNRGNVAGYEMLRLHRSADVPVTAAGDRAYRGEAYLGNGGGRARLVGFTPSSFTVDVQADTDDMLVLNQNAYPGWSVTIDGRTHRVRDDRLLVAAPVAQGGHRVIFRYRPNRLWAGVAVTLASLLVMAIKVLVARWRAKPKEGAKP